ncbi:MAG: hypothetical protein ACREQL_11945 [Candidatus Binatia bacterium]
MRSWGWLALAALLAAPLAGAQGLPPDADGDGVADDVDACLDTPTFDLVGGEGCSVCDCEKDPSGEAWTSRGAYLRCIVGAVRERRVAGTIARKQARLGLRAARNSTCGDENLVRCCVMFVGKDQGMCRVMDELRCDPDLLHADTTEDLDAGSCLPNPCLR